MIINAVILTIVENKEYSELAKTFLPIIIPSIVTIVGFIISYTQIKKNFENEITKYKQISTIENNQEIIRNFVNVLEDTYQKMKEKERVKYLNNLKVEIICFGSSALIKLFSEYQQLNYMKDEINEVLQSSGDEEKKVNILENKKLIKQFAYYCLVLAQMKYDFSNEVIDPLDYLKIKLNDYSINEELVKKIKNDMKEIVKELKLNKKFISK